MSEQKCRRCDWTGDDPAEHARAVGHPMCICGPHPLTVQEVRTCLRCVANARRCLDDIATAYALLPAETVNHSAEQIPGGQALVMLSPGSSGVAQLRNYLHGLPSDHMDDEWSCDAASVAFELSRFEDDWRLTFGDPPAEIEGAASVADHDRELRTLTAAVGYLWSNLDRAAREHPAFDEWVTDLRGLRTRLQGVTRSGPQRDTPCTKCGVPLELGYDEDEQEGIWTCPRCHRRYDQAAYWVALHQGYLEAVGE